MSERAPLVIIGTGLAGYNLAREWRKLDGETPLLMITADDGRSYSKPMPPPASKNKDADGPHGRTGRHGRATERAHPDPYRVTGIDPPSADLDRRGRGALSRPGPGLGCGADPVPVEGDAQDALYPINDLEDYARFRQAAAGKRRVPLLGAG